MKTCLFNGCELPVFSHGYCKRHQCMKTDDKKPKQTSFKPYKPRSFKKGTNTKDKQNNSLKTTKTELLYSFGFDNQIEMFEFVWKTRPHICQFTGANLDLVPKYQFHWMFLHILRKGTYRYYKYNPDNIVLGHPNFHLAADNFTEEERKKHPDWKFDDFFQMQEQKKQEYKQFIKDNQL